MKEKNENVTFKIDDTGVFIALTSMPFGNEEAFYENMKELIEKYKENSRKTNKKLGFKDQDDFFENYCYRPLGYCMWGSFDLAMISLVDDFSLSSRDFHPYSSLFTPEGDKEKKSFSYQVMTTVHTYPTKNTDDNENEFTGMFESKPLKDLWDEISIQTNGDITSKFNFIGISTFKINNGILLGVGSNSIDLIKLYLSKKISQFSSGALKFLILDSFSWYEIVILFFSDNINTIAKCLANCREATIEELLCYGENEIDSLNDKSFKEIKRDIIENSFIAKDIYKDNPDAIVNSHVFVNTYSHFGFNIDFLLKNTDIVVPEELTSQLKLIPKYTIKPGHYSKAKSLLTESNHSTNFNFLLGESDAFVNSSSGSLGQNHSFNFKEFHTHFKTHLNNAENFKQHIRRVKTMPYFKDLEVISPSFNDSEHTKSFLFNYAFDQHEINEIRRILCQLRISKVVRERVTRMYVNFNDGIQDPIMFIYFIDLKPLLFKLRFILNSILQQDDKEIGLDEFHSNLLAVAQIFEQAYENRFHQSHRLAELPNSNLDFNGGIQQIVSAMDTIYKIIYRELNGAIIGNKIETYYDGIFPDFQFTFPNVYVAAHSGVKSNQYSLRLNYFHVFEPAIFMAEIVKEASNFISSEIDEISYIRKIGNSNSDDIFFEAKAIFQYKEYSTYLRYLIDKNSNMHSYLLADRLTFSLGYFSDVMRYRFWYWHLNLQNTSAYNVDGNFNEEVFIGMLFRYTMLLSYFDIKDDDRYLAPSIKLQNLWNKHYQKLKEFSEQLHKLDTVKKYYSKGNSFASRIKSFTTPGMNIDSKYVNNYSDMMDTLKLKNKPESVIDIVASNKIPYSIISYFNIHLEKTKNVFDGYHYMNSILEREYADDGSDDILDLANFIGDEKHSLKFDPLGGFFSAGYESKRQLFRRRVGAIKAMIDFSLKYKASFVKEKQT
jgi:hypothetical protein